MNAPRSLYGLPIKAIPRDAIMGLLVKEEGYSDYAASKLLSRKKWSHVEVFPLL
jgi:hypothetical protein